MLAVISPAKSLNFDTETMALPATEPQFPKAAGTLARAARKLSKARLKAMMDLSDDLTELNYRRFKAFSDAPGAETVKPAAFAFAGDTYIGLEFATMTPEAQAYAQDNLRILSGLYGMLRPMDAIQPYRLEMGRKLKTRRGETLYDYWDREIGSALRDEADATGSTYLINLASTEYFRAVNLKKLGLPVISPVFEDEKNGEHKVIGFFAKRARGAMARFVMENRIRTPDELAGFTWGGYAYQPGMSSETAPVFRRAEAMAA